jgi:hypothetical protein
LNQEDVKHLNSPITCNEIEPVRGSPQKEPRAGHQQLMPVILATQEAGIRRIVVQYLPREIVHETLSQKYLTQKGLVEWLKL